MKTLVLDIERTPSIATLWSLRQKYIGIENLLNDSDILCFAAAWLDGDDVEYYSTQRHGKKRMIKKMWQMLDEADEVITYNGDAFDLRVLNTDFIKLGLGKPSPFKSIDLYKVVKKNFNLISYKLDYVLKYFKLGKKREHEGHTLWLKVMNKDAAAWKVMEEYNIDDVRGTLKLYWYLAKRGWLGAGRSHATADNHCPDCNNPTLVLTRKKYYTRTMMYPLYKCKSCNTWHRHKKGERIPHTNLLRV